MSNALTYAQTNLQLYEQIRRAGWPLEDVILVREACWTAVQLFSAAFRASGKPFVAHLVGTASILVAHDSAVETVVAGLLHAAYESGDFGDGHARPSLRRRARMRDAVGPDVERRLYDYHGFAWDEHAVQLLLRDAEQLSPHQRELALIRCANELEEHLDLGRVYSQKRGRLWGPAARQSLTELMEVLGHEGLARELQTAWQRTDEAFVPGALKTEGRGSTVVVPASYWVRPRVGLQVLARRARTMGRRLLHVVRRA